MVIKKYTIYWVDLNPTEGTGSRPRPWRMQPCVVVSPDELNQYLQTVMVAPLDSTPNNYPWRPACDLKGKKTLIALDQIRTVQKDRVSTAYDRLSKSEINRVQEKLSEMFL